MNRFRSFFSVCGLFSLLVMTLVGSGPALAQGAPDLNISPKRVVFSGTNRTALVYVFNRGTAGATYAVDVTDRVMLPDGQILATTEIADEKADAKAVVARLKSSRSMLTYTPRRVTLAPGESQVIRLRYLPPANLAAGEYRSHLTVATLPSEDVGVTAEQATELADGQLSIKVVSLLALSIPVIVRQDVSAATPALEGLKLERIAKPAEGQPPAYLDLDLVRASGEGSVYGTFEVRVEKGRGKPESIGALKGIAVYPEIQRRAVRLALSRAPVAGEKLSVRFLDETDAGTGVQLTAASLDVR